MEGISALMNACDTYESDQRAVFIIPSRNKLNPPRLEMEIQNGSATHFAEMTSEERNNKESVERHF